MNRCLNVLLDQTRRTSSNLAHPTPEHMLQLLAALLLVPGALLVLSGVFAFDVSQLAIGVLVMVAGGRLLGRRVASH
ncbi:hypothetical protein ACSMEV_11195 [Pseudomonas sp. MLB6B]